MTIRPIAADDARAFVELLEQLDRESSFMLFEPGERTPNVEAQRERILTMAASSTQVVFVAELDSALVGFIGSTAGAQRRSRRTASLVLGVRHSAQGRGMGSALLRRLEQWARDHELRRLELTVMAHNERAIALYQRQGFVVEGTRVDALQVDGQLVDELYMAKILK